jgi:hypothetical protein
VSHIIRTLSPPQNLKKFPSGITEINKRPLHPLAKGSNFNICWKYLTQVEKIKGGMNSFPVPALMGGSHTLIMGLIFKLMQHYTVESAVVQDKLLDWVRPRCEPHKEVKNYTSSWQDAKAIVALWNYLITEDAEIYEWLVKENDGKELTIDLDLCTTDPEKAIESAVHMFNQRMNVPLMVTPHDMIQCDMEFKQTNQVYLAEIRNAFVETWYPETKKKYEMWKEQEKSADEDLKNIQIGLELYEQALAALRKAQNSSTTMTEEIVTTASEEMSTSNGTDEEFDVICDSARSKLGPNDEQYDYAKDLFEQAYETFKRVKGRKSNELNKEWKFKEKMSDCNSKKQDCDNYKDSTHDNLDVKLEELRDYWKGKKDLELLLERYNTDVDTINTEWETIIDKTVRSFENTRTERQRRENTAKGREEVLDEINKILPYKEEFLTTEKVVSEEEDRVICQEKQDEIDNRHNFWINEYDRRMRAELDSDKYADEEEVADLLALYHKFSVDLETYVRKEHDENHQLIPAVDQGIGNDYNETKSRLDDIQRMMQEMHFSERDLRRDVQRAVDEKFDAENLPGKAWYKPNYEV